jgi:hypothetical protein
MRLPGRDSDSGLSRVGVCLLGGLIGLAALFVGITWLALEGGEVATLYTSGASGVVHETRVWVVDSSGSVWVEAATTERPFYRDLLENPTVELERQAHRVPYVAGVVPGAEGHAKIRRLLRAKYGLADVWIGLLQDTSESVAIKLRPVAPRLDR